MKRRISFPKSWTWAGLVICFGETEFGEKDDVLNLGSGVFLLNPGFCSDNKPRLVWWNMRDMWPSHPQLLPTPNYIQKQGFLAKTKLTPAETRSTAWLSPRQRKALIWRGLVTQPRVTIHIRMRFFFFYVVFNLDFKRWVCFQRFTQCLCHSIHSISIY